MPDLMNALEQCRQGFTIAPKEHGLYRLMGFALQEQARETWDRGGNPFPLLDQARASIDQAISTAPAPGMLYYPSSLGVLGRLLAQRARYLRARGEDPSLSLREAEEVLKRDLKRSPNLVDHFVTLGSVHVIRAGFNMDRGLAPGPDLARAEKELRNVLTQNRNDEEAWLQLGEVQALRAKWRVRSGRARAEDFEEATKSYEKAIELNPHELEYPLRLGQHCYTWATWQKQSGGEHGLVLKRGLALADQILKIRPDWREAQDLRANLLQASQ